jgi:hypothetical protein
MQKGLIMQNIVKICLFYNQNNVISLLNYYLLVILYHIEKKFSNLFKFIFIQEYLKLKTNFDKNL